MGTLTPGPCAKQKINNINLHVVYETCVMKQLGRPIVEEEEWLT
jgi:hypothetical protein